jgi:hypothetical protein
MLVLRFRNNLVVRGGKRPASFWRSISQSGCAAVPNPVYEVASAGVDENIEVGNSSRGQAKMDRLHLSGAAWLDCEFQLAIGKQYHARLTFTA